MIVVYLVLGILALGVIVLAAMVGELAARVSVLQMTRPEPQQLTTAAIGTEPPPWPGDGPQWKEAGSRGLLVLSTNCATCETVAAELPSMSDLRPVLKVCLSTPNTEAALSFIERHDLRKMDIYIDKHGAWAKQYLAVDVSPALIRISRGRIADVYAFERPSDISKLLATEVVG